MNLIEERLFKNVGLEIKDLKRKEIQGLSKRRILNIRALEDYVLQKVTLEQALKIKNPAYKVLVYYLTFYGRDEEIDNYEPLLGIEKICPQCNKVFIHHGNQIYCSKRCRYRAYYLMRKNNFLS